MSSRNRAGARAPKGRLPGEGARTRAMPANPLSAVVRRSSRAHDVTPRPRVARQPPRPAARWRRCPPAEAPPLCKTHNSIGRLLGQSARQARSRDHARLLSNNQRGRACSPTLPRGWAGSVADWYSGLSVSAAVGASGRRLALAAVNQRGGRGPGVMRKSGGLAPLVAVEGGWPRWLRWVSLLGPRFAAVSGAGGPAGDAANNGSIARAAAWRGLNWRPPRSPRAPGAAPGPPGSDSPGLIAALAAVPSRPAATAPGAGKGSKGRGQGPWSGTADAVWGKVLPQSLLWEGSRGFQGVRRDSGCVVRSASSVGRFP